MGVCFFLEIYLVPALTSFCIQDLQLAIALFLVAYNLI